MADDVTATATAADPMAALASVDADLAAAQASIDELLQQASFEDPSRLAAPAPEPARPVQSWTPPQQQSSSFAAPSTPPPPTQSFNLPGFTAASGGPPASGMDLLNDVELNVKIELGRSRMMVEDVLKLGEGSVVELDKLAGDPVDVYVNDKLVARGEVLVLNDNFCVRVNEIVVGAREEAL